MSDCRHWRFKYSHTKDSKGRRVYQCQKCGKSFLIQWRDVHSVFAIVIFSAIRHFIILNNETYLNIGNTIRDIDPKIYGSILGIIFRIVVEGLVPYCLASILVLPFLQHVNTDEQEVNGEKHKTNHKKELMD